MPIPASFLELQELTAELSVCVCVCVCDSIANEAATGAVCEERGDPSLDHWVGGELANGVCVCLCVGVYVGVCVCVSEGW